MTIDAADHLAIHELLGLYGHLIDERRWDELDEVFIADVVYDPSDFGHPVTQTLAAVHAAWTGDLSTHPLAHHATNIVVSQDPDGTVRVVSKGIGVGPKGRVGSVIYRDVVVKTANGCASLIDGPSCAGPGDISRIHGRSGLLTWSPSRGSSTPRARPDLATRVGNRQAPL